MSLELEEGERFRFYRLNRREKEKLLERIIRTLAEREEVKLAIVYGSFLKDYPFRDIDIAVYIAPPRDPLNYKLKLEELLERQTGYPVDVTVLNEAPPWFTRKVLGEGRLLLSRQPLLRERLYLKTLDEQQLANTQPSTTPRKPLTANTHPRPTPRTLRNPT